MSHCKLYRYEMCKMISSPGWTTRPNPACGPTGLASFQNSTRPRRRVAGGLASTSKISKFSEVGRIRKASSDSANQVLRGKSAKPICQAMLSSAIVVQQELRRVLKLTRIANQSGRKLQQPTVMSEAVVRASSVLNILNRCLPTDMMFSDANVDCSSSSEFAVSPVISHSKRLFSFAVEAKATKTCRCYLVVVGHSQLLQRSLSGL